MDLQDRKGGNVRKYLKLWCREPESNRHASYKAQDFKFYTHFFGEGQYYAKLAFFGCNLPKSTPAQSDLKVPILACLSAQCQPNINRF